MPDRLFLFGTLRHRPVLDALLGHDRAVTAPAHLPGHAVRAVAGESWPVLVPGSGADGLAWDPDPADRARIDAYERAFGYAPAPVTLSDGQGASVYVPREAPGTDGPWDLDAWAARWGAVHAGAAAEAAGHLDDPAALGRLMPAFRARAWAGALAAAPAPATRRRPPGAARAEVARAPLARGFFRLDGFDVAFDDFGSARHQVRDRSGFVAFDAALVLPYDPATRAVLLVEQLRFGPLLRGDPALHVLEPVAGLVDAGEAPEDAARREAAEETGLTLTTLHEIARTYPSPGYSSEFHHCFAAPCDLSGADGRRGGLAHESEDILAHVLPLDDALGMIATGEVNAGPLAMMLLWLDRHLRDA
ncbi:MAG: NUDIX domain-containing protein [Paracoccaceae bacterium]